MVKFSLKFQQVYLLLSRCDMDHVLTEQCRRKKISYVISFRSFFVLAFSRSRLNSLLSSLVQLYMTSLTLW